MTQALGRLSGSFLLRVDTQTSPRWKFHHPSLAHALGKHIGQNSELVGIFISELTERALFTMVDRGAQQDVSRETVVTPEACYAPLINRISELQDTRLLCESLEFAVFLASCCSPAFLLRLAELRGDLIGMFTHVDTLRFGVTGIRLLACLRRAGLLPERERRSAVVKTVENASSLPTHLEVDFDDWAKTCATTELTTPDEYQELRERAFRDVLPELADVIEDPGSTIEWESEEDWLHIARHYEAAVVAYRVAYEDHPDASAELSYTEDVLSTYLYSSPLCGGGFEEEESEEASGGTESRSVFDDLDSV
ncbi:hypothetical protein ADK70_19405 [Streptomyces rimosus subsp. pseudoverticillatus]|nr:hypothetical protein ADK70_19405 [Streptomyces rimosus subsp. pseudoverticillatus]